MGMSDYYLFTNQLRKICEKLGYGFTYVGGMWTLYGLQKKGIKRIFILLVWGDYWRMEESYVGKKNNIKECMKGMELGCVLFFFSFPSLPL